MELFAYSALRSETFLPYLSGQHGLFLDHFSGQTGIYVYEEVPNSQRRRGLNGKLEGFIDAILKVFGV